MHTLRSHQSKIPEQELFVSPKLCQTLASLRIPQAGTFFWQVRDNGSAYLNTYAFDEHDVYFSSESIINAHRNGWFTIHAYSVATLMQHMPPFTIEKEAGKYTVVTELLYKIPRKTAPSLADALAEVLIHGIVHSQSIIVKPLSLLG